jgi:type IX secretion system PorP/SprF family membrane protein
MRGLTVTSRYVFLLMGIFLYVSAAAQDVPTHPRSIPVYNPLVLNPAFAGSKDFTNISLTSKVIRNPTYQLINIHQRITGANGFFSNIGVGAYTFHEQLDRSWNTGLAVAGSYHIALDKANVHNISAGGSLKGLINVPKSGEEISGDTLSNAFNPNVDVGIYYYGPTAFAGFSVTSLLGTKVSDEIPLDSDAFIEREYHLYGGYKVLLSRSKAIVLEPSVLVSLNDSSLSEPQKHVVPYLKIYLQNFYVGTCYKSKDLLALFFQYQFPRFYTGAFLEFPRVGFLNNENIIFELSLGINIGHGDYRFRQYRHW